ncbi:RING-H2 finger protein ATL66-like [Lolium perenne]|uniref:RING-H2 finger protein ATL66-like n=1 Tax=Lolium perenne TaxID=4522 RepID=UPI0021F5CDBE|nr:probable E3 ubiquitin-protein ligase ATL44 [Lolium perenne]
MAEFAGLSVLWIILAVLALIAVVAAIVWAVRCAIARRGAESSHAKEGLLNKEALCAICKGLLAGGEKCRRLRVCGHVYHAECVDPWLRRKTICPLCRAKVEVSRTDIVDAMV